MQASVVSPAATITAKAVMFPPRGILVESHFIPILFNDISFEVIFPFVVSKSTVIPLFANFS